MLASTNGARAVAPVALRRSEVTSLPVSGNGSIAAGVATSVAGDIARSAVETALTERLEGTSDGGGGSVGASFAASGLQRSVSADGSITVRRAPDDSEPVAGDGSGFDLEAHKDELLRFAMSDEFEERLLEFLEDRLLSEIERRGGRYGGWFA